MSFLTRAASLAVAAFGAALMMGTSPGTAHELDRAPLVNLNAPGLPPVPAATTPSPLPQVETQLPEVDPAVLAGASNDYATLQEAVSAQTSGIDDGELRCLAAGVFYESHGEPLAGQLAVAQTIVNRTRSGRFPKSVCSVLKQRGQFSFVRGGVVPSGEGRRGWDTAVAVSKVALRDLWDGVAEQALYFHARHVTPGFRGQRLASIGNHVFYR